MDFLWCFGRYPWEMKQNYKFDTTQLFHYILNTQKMCHQSQPSSLIKVWTFFDVLADILERWSKITNLTLTNCFITYWTFKNCVIKANQVISSKYGLFLMFWQISLRDEAELQIWHYPTVLLHIEHSKNVSSKPAK